MPGALLVIAALFIGSNPRIVSFATSSRLPSMYPYTESVNAGGLMSYGPNRPDLFRRAATYVDKILKGTKPADLPPHRAVNEVRVRNQSQDHEATWSDDSAVGPVSCG